MDHKVKEDKVDTNITTVFNWISDDWRRVKNHCRTTDNKDFTENDATDRFKMQLLISEHSPIRLIEFDWTWKPMPYWVHAEWARHKFEKFVSTQRDDRLKDSIPRGKKPQEAPVTFDGFANMQNLIDTWRKRLCNSATPEARSYGENFKYTLHKTKPLEADVLVPHCIYRGGCPEFKECGFWSAFVQKYQKENLLNIQERYDLYNKEFYERMEKIYG